MSVTKLSLLALVSVATALPGGNGWSFHIPSWGSRTLDPFKPIINSLFPQLGAPLTPEILKTFEQPNLANIARNSYITRKGSKLLLNGDRYVGGAANVYWLGLDENVIPPAGEPFYEPFNASYPTLGRITEVMNTLVTMGAKTIRSHTLGVSTGNPLSIMPNLGEVNQEAFATIDWAIFQARQHGLRIIIPLTDAYVSMICPR
jgi:mannan endo-1,4-beta-mannosidase